jgi:large subunit ribosomal protein L24
MQGNKFHVKKGDTVVVVAGKDKSKSGKVLQILPKREGVLVEGLNIVKRHTRARGNEPGGIVEKEAPVKKARVCVKCGESFDK